MVDPRVARLARILTGYSTRVHAGDVVLIECSGAASLPLVREVYRQCLRRGAALVEYQVGIPELTRDFFDLASGAQLARFPAHRLEFLKQVTVTVGIRSEENLMDLASVPRERVTARTRVLRPLLDQRVNHTRWVVTRVPTPSLAQDSGCSLEELEDLYFTACLNDWAAESRKQDRLVKVLRGARTARLVGPDTDLTLEIAGMPIAKADGHHNMPDGEVFTVPARASAQGKITFNCPSYFGGTRFEGIHLEFRRGKVVKARADRGQEDLDQMLAIDEGARYLGEFAFGLNPGITRPVGNILFDEKIAGSVHLALGNAYGTVSNGNQSAIHWDLVRIMRDGEVHLDGRPIQKNGLFTLPALRELNPPRA